MAEDVGRIVELLVEAKGRGEGGGGPDPLAVEVGVSAVCNLTRGNTHIKELAVELKCAELLLGFLAFFGDVKPCGSEGVGGVGGGGGGGEGGGSEALWRGDPARVNQSVVGATLCSLSNISNHPEGTNQARIMAIDDSLGLVLRVSEKSKKAIRKEQR
jgi:hypothetical protein